MKKIKSFGSESTRYMSFTKNDSDIMKHTESPNRPINTIPKIGHEGSHYRSRNDIGESSKSHTRTHPIDHVPTTPIFEPLP